MNIPASWCWRIGRCGDRPFPTSSNHINALDLCHRLCYGSGDNPLIAKRANSSSPLLSSSLNPTSSTRRIESIIDDCLSKIYKKYLESNYTTHRPRWLILHKALKAKRTKRAGELALAIQMVSTGNLNMFAHPTNVDVHNRIVSYGIRDLGSQLRTPGMLVMTDAIRNRVARKPCAGAAHPRYHGRCTFSSQTICPRSFC